MNYSSELSRKIEAQEIQDRYVASECLKVIFQKGENLVIVPTDIRASVDLNCSVVNLKKDTIPFNVEIKERNKNEWQMKNYPYAELKVDKYRRMREATPEGTRLLYMVLLNNKTCYLFHMDKLDWTKVGQMDWTIKRTQMDPKSDYITVPTLLIPFEQACYTMDCSEYVNEYKSTITF